VTLRRFLMTTAFVLFAGPVAAVSPVAADTDPAEFVRTLSNTALEVIRADTTAAQKRAFFHQLLQQDFDLPGIAQFVLGPFWVLQPTLKSRSFAGSLRITLSVSTASDLRSIEARASG
jgi:ABC-type transporter MlaC component